MVEVELDQKTPSAILIPFAMLTAVLIFVHLFSLVIATRLLPELEAACHNPHLSISLTITRGNSWPVQLVWYMSNIVGIALFLVELVLVAYVKFYPYDESVTDRIYIGTATLLVVVVLSLISLPFIVILFRSISKRKIQHHEQTLASAKELLESINQTHNLDADSGYTASGPYMIKDTQV